jgi:hypothetical protein
MVYLNFILILELHSLQNEDKKKNIFIFFFYFIQGYFSHLFSIGYMASSIKNTNITKTLLDLY